MTVVSFVFMLIDASSGIPLFSIHIKLYPQRNLYTETLCTDYREGVAVMVETDKSVFEIFLVYIRPSVKEGGDAE